MELPLPQRRLPHATMLGLLILEEDEELRIYLRDLENFSPSLRVSYVKARRNAVMAPQDLLAAGITVPAHLRGRREVYVAFTTLAMGDLNALAHTQEAHELLLERGGLRPAFLRYGRAIPRGALQVGAYVDDLAVLEIVKRDMIQATCRSAAEEAAQSSTPPSSAPGHQGGYDAPRPPTLEEAPR